MPTPSLAAKCLEMEVAGRAVQVAASHLHSHSATRGWRWRGLNVEWSASLLLKAGVRSTKGRDYDLNCDLCIAASGMPGVIAAHVIQLYKSDRLSFSWIARSLFPSQYLPIPKSKALHRPP